MVSFTVQGSDPWLGTPVAILEQDTGSGFAPVLRPNTTEVTSDGYEFWVELTADPAYQDQMPAASRRFDWTFFFPVTHRVPGSVSDLSGQLRFRVIIPTDSEGSTTEVITSAFSVEPG